MAQIISSVVHKGGTGKTTMAVHLAFHLSGIGSRVMVIDCDTQGNATQTWGDARDDDKGTSQLFTKRPRRDLTFVDPDRGILVVPADAGLVDVERLPVGAESRFRDNVRALAERENVDYVVIDTPPTLGFGMLAPLIASDSAFSPLAPDPYGIKGVASLVGRVEQIRSQYNRDLHYLGILINRFQRRNRDHCAVVQAMNDDLSDYLIPHMIGERAAIARVAFTSQPVWREHSGAAALAGKEVRAAMRYITSKMETQ